MCWYAFPSFPSQTGMVHFRTFGLCAATVLFAASVVSGEEIEFQWRFNPSMGDNDQIRTSYELHATVLTWFRRIILLFSPTNYFYMCIVYILPASQRPNPMGLNLLFKAITTGRVNPKENRDTLHCGIRVDVLPARPRTRLAILPARPHTVVHAHTVAHA